MHIIGIKEFCLSVYYPKMDLESVVCPMLRLELTESNIQQPKYLLVDFN